MIRELHFQSKKEHTQNIDIPPNAAITITNNCGECDFCVKTTGQKFACEHPRIMSKRPYTSGENNRSVISSLIPPWCPLYVKEYNPK